jgi:monoamine oxidase
MEPALPQRTEAASRVRTGSVAKVVLEFRRRFWESREDMKKMAFLFWPEGRFPTLWTGPADYATLNVWAGGPRAAALCGLSDDDVVRDAIESAAGAMHLDVAELEKHLVRAHFHNWMRDPFARGAYTYVGVGGADAHKMLARPAGDSLFFAGESTIGGGYNATMEGAVRSGYRAAHELLAAHAGSSEDLARK